MLIRELFSSDVTRDIPPVVYFHEQTPAKVAAEVDEYIITGGWPENHPNHRRVPDGIHEQYVRLLTNIASELDRPGGPDLPNAWISGFYGSGKSSFAKLLGLALDGLALPDGRSLAEAWLKRDTSPRAADLQVAWANLRQKIEPLAVVFDVGGFARDNEHIHAAAVRQVQQRLGYCATEPLVADFELKLERDGEYGRFEQLASEVLAEPWDVLKGKAMAEDDFSLVMSEMFPRKYTDPMAWIESRAGVTNRASSPDDAVVAIGDMLRFRKPGATLFIVVDEVSQYVLSSHDRVERLRAFAEKLGAHLKGQAWLLALGQQKVDEEADASFLVKTKDRFPPKLRVHLAATNIRDVVHRRLLHKKHAAAEHLRGLFEKHRHDLKLFAYGCEAITPDEFVDTYPMLPGHIDLLLQITSALRTRSARAQGDDQAIRGLLQLLGELFREQQLADLEVGHLVTLDQIYEVQHTALDSDVQASMARIFEHCADDASGQLVRCAKAVALLELIQDTVPTDAKLVAQCLYDRLDRGNHESAITEALEDLRRRNLLGYSEKTGYKLQSSAGEEWERERRDIGVPRETIAGVVQDALKHLLAIPDRPRLKSRPFPWAGVFSDGRRADDVSLLDPRDDALVRVDFRFLVAEERTESTWVKRSAEAALEARLIWVVGDSEQVDEVARQLARSRAMVRKYEPRRESLNPARKLLLQQEQNKVEDLEVEVRKAVDAAWMAGRMYFRGRVIRPLEEGASFATALSSAGNRLLPELFPHFVGTQVSPSELKLLLASELTGLPPVFMDTELGLFEIENKRYVPTCHGVVPTRVLEHIDSEGGVSGTALIAYFGGPPYGYPVGVVQACVAGLLRATKVRINPEGGAEITAVRDVGVREVFEKDRAFRRANIFGAGEDDIGFPARARICKFFKKSLAHEMDREDNAIADAVASLFPDLNRRLLDVLARHRQIPGAVDPPPSLVPLQDALSKCVAAARRTKPTVKLVKKHLDALRDGVELLNLMDADLTESVIREVRLAATVRDHHAAQLRAVDALSPETTEAAARIVEHLERERPWNDVKALEADVALVQAEYRAERERLLTEQGQSCDAARARVKGREGFSTLSADQSNLVLRPIHEAMTDTDADAIAPSLTALRDSFQVALQRAENVANERLDELLSEGEKPMIQRVSLGLRNRELRSAEDVKALLDEIEQRVLPLVESGSRVRLT
jgi:hypothetical protein